MATNKTPYAEQVATTLIAQLQAGSAPWQRPWQPGELRLPYNALSGKEYRGMNTIWLHMQGHADPRWMTYKQAQVEGAQVRKGETGTRVMYWKLEDEQTMKDDQGRPVLDEEGQPRKIRVKLERPRVFTAVVFNAEQIDGLPALAAKPVGPEPERHARAEAILDRSGAKIAYLPGSGRAFYRPATDSITLPERTQFATADGFYAIALHELAHWSGHPSRLARDLAHPFGSEGYAREELRAEIASLMLGERLEIGHDPSQHAAYVGSWIKVLQDDPREIFRAASDAERITTYVMAFEQEQSQTQRRGQALAPDNGEQADNPFVRHQPPEERARTAQRTYLAVPYREKDAAKQLGAKWDQAAKSWYAPEGLDVQHAGLARWLPENTHVVAAPKQSPEASFADAIRGAGLVLEGAPVMDGQLHRLPVAGDRGGARSGAYAGHLEGRIPGGYIENFKAGARINWKFEGKMDAIRPAEAARLEAEARERQAQRAAEIAGRHARMASIATALWNEAEPATPDNPYCAAKGIGQPGENGLRVVPASVSAAAQAQGVRIARDPREAKAMRAAEPDARVFMTGDLLLPARDGAGTLWSVQTVNPRFKGFLKEGRKAGLFTVAGARPEDLATALENNPSMPLVLTEGYATGDTVARLAGQPVVVAFDSGNLDAVARALRQRWPERPLLIAADNDHLAAKETLPSGKPRGNVGAAKARQAAASHQGGVMLPRFAAGEQGSDWNDYAARHGDEAARKELARQMAAAKTEATMAAEHVLYLAREREAEAVNARTTSADGVQVARERGAAEELMGRAVAESGEVRAQATNALAASVAGQVRTLGSVLAGIDRDIGEMRDEVQEERAHVRDGQGVSTQPEQKPQQQRRRARGRGFDPEL
jgi:putative DNA primase/helicase